MDTATLQKTLDEIAAEYVRRLKLRVEAIDAGADSVTLSLPVTPELVHAGGVLCGQAIMSAADTAMLVAMIAKIGGFKPMTTVQLQASFLRPVPKETCVGDRRARVLRLREDAQLRGGGVSGAGREDRGACDDDVCADLS